MAAKENRQTQAYHYMKEQIESQSWLPKQHIREVDVANSLNISRTPVRKAIDQLTSEGYLEKIPHKGIQVGKPDLTKKDFQNRMEFIELLLIHYFQKLQSNEQDFQTDDLAETLNQMSVDLPIEEFLDLENAFWQQMLAYEDNDFIQMKIMTSFKEVYSQKGYFAQVMKGSQPDKLKHFNNILGYLIDNNYPYVRREVRILLNQLILNIFQGSRDMPLV